MPPHCGSARTSSVPCWRWILVGLKLGHALPVIAGIDLNKEPTREPVDAL